MKMANSDESNPLLPNQEEIEMANEKKSGVPVAVGENVGAAIPVGWTADGLPVSESMTEMSH